MILHVFYGVYAWMAVAAIGIPGWLIIQLVPKSMGSHCARRIFRQLCRWALYLTGLRPKVEGEASLNEAVEWSETFRALVLVSNHSSYLDVLVLGAALPLDFRFVVKSDAASWPIVGTFIKRCDFVPVWRNDPSRATDDLERVGKYLSRGQSIHIFPEGTFTRASGIRPFQMGALKLAVETACPILPITLQGMREVLRDGDWLPKRYPIRVTVGAMLHPGCKGTQEQVRLRDAVRQEFLLHCGEGSLELILAGPPRPGDPSM